MNKKLVRNIFWIALVAVWSFWAGAYFHLGWVRKASVSYREGFILGGIALWIVLGAIGILIYRFLKKHESSDPAKPALVVVSFFTLCFMLIGWVKYDEVKKDEFIKEIKEGFIVHYTEKANEKQLKIKNLYEELDMLYITISFDLENHPQLEKLMQLKTEHALFEENTVIEELCVESMKSSRKYGYPPEPGMEELFE
ncbi:MAG: hypothetical protein ACO1N0_14790 [Fluviicola sp.]